MRISILRRRGNARPAGGIGRVCFAATVLTATACGGGAEPETHEHGSVVVTQWNEATELFLEYPHLVAGQATGNWAIHLTDIADFQPIRAGTLTVRFLDGAVASESFTVDGVARDGIFLLDPVVERAGTYRVELALESPQARSVHVLPDVTVYPEESAVPREDEDEDGTIAFLKEQQWQIPFAVVPAREGAVRRTVEAPGEIVAPDGALVEVAAPVDGLASADANRRSPSVGQSVRAGELLAVLSPTTQEDGFAQAAARVERLEREVARAERLHAAGAIAAKRLEEARHDLEVARAQAAAFGTDGVGDDYRLRLVSPISGVIARRAFVPGGRVEAGEPLFTIVAPGSAWLRVQVPPTVAASIPEDARAAFTPEGSDEARETGRLVSVGRVLDDRTRTVPVVFEIDDPEGRLAFGQMARARVPVGGTVPGVVIPDDAIVDDNGTPVAYVQAGGETFERRVLGLGATDGVRTQVTSGIHPGEMVVTTGAFQVRLASMSGGEFAGGHAH
jgi:membrane fusion protein, heavy metal efflux system